MYDIKREFSKRNVVIYARVSTDHEAQLSALGNQVDWYKPILENHPEWTLLGMYIDEGITGTSAEKRPQFMKMMKDAKKHKFDMIITREVSRFARNTVDTLQYTRMLRSSGIEVYFINDNIKTFDGDGELRLTIMATLAQDESRKTSIRVKSGQQTSMENGVYYGNGNILGYDKVGKEMIINEEQAKTVRLIFDLYLSGYGLRKIKYELERQKRLTSKGKEKWFETVISNILNNSFYCGIIKYHKEYTPDFLEQKRIKNRGEIEYTYVKGRHVPIITEEEYIRVQKILNQRRTKLDESNKEKKQRGHIPKKTAWGRLLVCECGKGMYRRCWTHKEGKVNYGFLCYNQANSGTIKQRKNHNISVDDCCDTPMIPEWKLQMMASRIFKNYIADADKVLELANEMLAKHISDKEDMDNSDIIEQYNKKLDKLEKKLDNYIEMRADGEISREVFLLKTDELQKKILLTKSEINELKKENKEVECDYEAVLKSLRIELEKYIDFENEINISESVVEGFIEKIVVHKNYFEWYLRTTRSKESYKDSVSEFEHTMQLLEKNEDNTNEHKLLVDSFVLTKEDALEYMYSIDTKKRVHRWKDIEVRLYA